MRAAEAGAPDWPGTRPGFRVGRHRRFITTGAVAEETGYGVASLDADRAAAARLLGLVPYHGPIENRSQWVGEATDGEDASPVRVGAIARVMTIIRTPASARIRLSGATQIAAAGRRFAAKPVRAVALLTQPSTTK